MVDFNENVLARNGEDGRDHIVALPFWVAIIRAVQFVCDFDFPPQKYLSPTSELTGFIGPDTSRYDSLCIRIVRI